MPRRPRQPFAPSTTEKVNIVLPKDCADAFRRQSIHEYSDEWLGAGVLWMAAKRKYPLLCEAAFRNGKTKKPETAVAEIVEKLAEYVSDGLILEYLKTLSEPERGRVLAQMRMGQA